MGQSTDPAPATPGLPRVCVIGAGCCGLTALKALSDAGILADGYEISSLVGGNWVFKNPNGLSGAYRSLHINTSRQRMQFADFPMPDDYPDFPRHDLVARYFDAYAEQFHLKRLIRFRTKVERAVLDAGTWRVFTDDGAERQYDALLVANGHHWKPNWPSVSGSFDGPCIHSHDYIDPTEPLDLRHKNVLIVGMGNSAMDLASELGRAGTAGRVLISGRRGAYVIPKYIYGKPLDQRQVIPRWLPSRARRKLVHGLYTLAVGRMEDYGLPTPDHPFGATHPTVSEEFLTRMGSGDVAYRPAIDRLLGSRVRFVDGREEPVDAIIYCTGYQVSFPFLDRELIDVRDNELWLYRRVFKVGVPNLFFIGLAQPLGAIMPIAEAQAKWTARYLCGDYNLPDDDQMWRHIRQEHARIREQYVPSLRHTMQIDFDDYLNDLARECERGKRRAMRMQGQAFRSTLGNGRRE